MRIALAALVVGAFALLGCTRTDSQARSVYVLLDVSGSYSEMVPQALRSTKLLITRLRPNDSIAVARIDACSFSEAAVLARGRLEDRPSAASLMKRDIAARIDRAGDQLHATDHTDITGAIYQAGQALRRTQQGNRYLIIFSDLQEDLPRTCKRTSLPDFDLSGIHVIAALVSRLPSDNRNPAHYTRRLENWRSFALDHGAADWRIVDDPVLLADLIAGRGAG